MIGTYKFGIIAEYIVIFMLLLKGYKILQLRYRNYAGEIDIIAHKKKLICFIEVKARMKLDRNYDLVSEKQVMRIRRAASLFLAQHTIYNDHDVRFDLVIVSSRALPQHLKNVW